MTADRDLRDRAAQVFPGGMFGHLNAKHMPPNYPQFMESGHGARVTDVDGNEYLDFVCAFGPNLFGYGHPAINEAYIKQLLKGDQITGPTALMVDLAECLVGMISHADWAIFAKNGSDVTTAAWMIARAYSGRDKLIMADGAYHGAASPWATGRPGASRAEQAAKLFCTYNDVGSLERAVAEADGDLAAIFASPTKQDLFVDQAEPSSNYMRRARELCDQTGALLVVDEIRSGFRISRDCSWSSLGVHPDLSTWGKTLANGHAIAALLGSDKAREAAARVFLCGTFWYQAAPMAAALVALREVRESNYLERMCELGGLLRSGLDDLARSNGIAFRQSGALTMPMFRFDNDADLRKSFFWCGEMLRNGIYTHPYHNMFLNAAMTHDDIELTLKAASRSFETLERSLADLPPGLIRPAPVAATEMLGSLA